jgi:ATP-dependent Zn protease
VDAALRRYLFPAMIALALIWLAVHTLGGGSGSKTKLRWSEATALVRTNSGGIESATFRPSNHDVELRLKSGARRRAVYPVDESAFALQQLLEKQSIPFDAKNPGSSPWWSLVTGLLPFVLLAGFWIYLMRRVPRPAAGPGPGSTGSASPGT